MSKRKKYLGRTKSGEGSAKRPAPEPADESHQIKIALFWVVVWAIAWLFVIKTDGF